ncbi:MAG TPA: hypothetical protein VEZ88_01985 [Steroidobacteraceae bacterium]|nr:hypothetical protein [Steroidobacteraceae bacterium]
MSRGTRLQIFAAALLLAACHSGPAQKPEKPERASSAMLLNGLSSYARKVRQQDESALLAEKMRLESLPESAPRDLRLAMLLDQERSSLYDPDRATQLLAHTVNQPNADPAERAFADMLLAAATNAPRSCNESGFTQDLVERLAAEEQHRMELTTRLESTRQELEAERSQRAKLEKQLEALKSIEAQIKSRENDAGR